MSANDKAAATYGRQLMTTAETLIAHADVGETSLGLICKCGREVGANGGYLLGKLAAHQAEMLEPRIVAREQEAWAQGVKTTLNHAIDNDDGITLRLEHLDGRPWENPYSARAEQ